MMSQLMGWDTLILARRFAFSGLMKGCKSVLFLKPNLGQNGEIYTLYMGEFFGPVFSWILEPVFQRGLWLFRHLLCKPPGRLHR